MSASVPADMMAIAMPRLYAVTTHCRPASPTLKSAWMTGKRDVHDQRVQKDHEEAEARGREREALRSGHGGVYCLLPIVPTFDSSICFTRLTTAGSISYNPFTIFSMPAPSIGSISSLAFSASARN